MRYATLLTLFLAPALLADVKEEAFGKLADGKEVKAYTLTNKAGMKAKIISYGAILAELHVPDKDGKLADVVLGYDNLEGYIKDKSYFGANVGRCANRIAGGKFKIEDNEYKLETNAGKHHLHGGKEGFNKKLWAGEVVEGEDAVKFTYESKDGEEGYPGNVTVTLVYTLTADNELKIRFDASTDKATLVNLAHHSYFNLAGHNAGNILKHKLELKAEKYTPTDETLVPTGKIETVEGTPFDFRKATDIGARIKDVKGDPQGYDVNFDVGDSNGEPALIATVVDPSSGRKMEVHSTEPGLQFYSGNFLDGKVAGKGGAKYAQHGAFCLEPQYFPDAIHHLGEEGWYNPVLTPEQMYFQTTIFKFSVQR